MNYVKNQMMWFLSVICTHINDNLLSRTIKCTLPVCESQPYIINN